MRLERIQDLGNRWAREVGREEGGGGNVPDSGTFALMLLMWFSFAI